MERKLSRRLSTPIRKIRRALHAERNAALDMEEQACEQMEQGDMLLSLSDGR